MSTSQKMVTTTGHRARFVALLKKFCFAPDDNGARRKYSMYDGLVPGARNVWSLWTDHIMKEADRFNFISTAMFTFKGRINSFSGGNLPSEPEIQELNEMFENNNQSDSSDNVRLTYSDCTYVKRSCDDDIRSRHLVAFHGHRYLLVLRSRSMYVAVLMNSNRQQREQLQDALRWLDRLTCQLISKGH